MKYKVFKKSGIGVSNYAVSLEEVDESLDYYSYLSNQKEKGLRQVILTMDYLLHIAERLSYAYSIKGIEVDVAKEYNPVIEKCLDVVNKDNSTHDILKFALMGITNDDVESIKVRKVLLGNGKSTIELGVNGVIEFSETPSTVLKDEISNLIGEKFNRIPNV